MVIENPVGNSPKDPYEEYRKQKEREAHEAAPAKKPFYPLLQILLWMRAILDSLITGSKPKTIDSLQPLKQLKKSFEIMKSRDCSQEVDFSNTLSSCWNRTLVLSRKHPFPLLRSFLKEIQNYPQGEDHTLGYYLTEYAGQNWLPFPYIELLKKIHAEHKSSPTTSHLTRWTRELDQLLALETNS